MSQNKHVLITGGAGFIGSHAVKYFLKKYPGYSIYNLDSLTYAGNLDNLKEIEDNPNYRFIHGDITDPALLSNVFTEYGITDIMHFAAESHVDRSITDPLSFIKTNIYGTFNLLHQAKKSWEGNFGEHVFYHVSTDEVYGSLGPEGLFVETTPYDPQSPYSASKASSDHFVRAFANTYGLNIKISNCSNNYGPYQFPEKLIPLVINNIKNNKKLPIYGDGKYVRDWLYVEDHVTAIDAIFHRGNNGETYNVGGNCELENIQIVHMLCDIMDEIYGRPKETSRRLIEFVRDRPGHDRRYAIDCTKLMDELKWSPSILPEEGMRKTVNWYLENQEWLNRVTSGAYRTYYERQYR